MQNTTHPKWLWLALPAVAMTLGWGLRGYIGGGPLGAMIPGAMTAMALALLLGLDDEQSALLAAFGAIGIGFGGQETYGQTVGLARVPETFWWAILGFFIKGGVWGLLGGAAMATAIEFRRAKWRTEFVWSGLALMTIVTWAGWKLINQPKLVYFSNRLDKPREELWAGLLLGVIAYLVWMGRGEARKAMWCYALWGGIGGGIGFALGAWVQVAGLGQWPKSGIDWWKMMEFTFGLLLGLGYGIAAWLNRREPVVEAGKKARPKEPFWLVIGILILLVGVGVGGEYLAETRINFTIAGAILLAAALRSQMICWQIAVTVTFFAFAVDLLENRPTYGWEAWVCAILATVAVAWFTARWQNPRSLFLLLTLTAVGDSMLKSYLPPLKGAPSLSTQAVFVGSAVACIWMARMCRQPQRSLKEVS